MDEKKLGKRNRLSTSQVVIAHVQWIKTSFRVNGGNEKNTRALLNNSMVCTPTINVWMYTFCHSQQLAEKNASTICIWLVIHKKINLICTDDFPYSCLTSIKQTMKMRKVQLH